MSSCHFSRQMSRLQLRRSEIHVVSHGVDLLRTRNFRIRGGCVLLRLSSRCDSFFSLSISEDFLRRALRRHRYCRPAPTSNHSSQSFRGIHSSQSSSLSAKRVEKPLKTAGDMRQAAAAPLALLQNIAGRLHFAQTAVIGLCVRASLKPIYELKVEGAGPLSEWARKSSGWRAGTLPSVAPRLMTDSKKSLAIQGRPVPILLG